jgi:ACS family glucarate transporter-like MFS transporter
MIQKRFVLVAATFLASVLLYVDRACISTAKDPMLQELQLTDKQWGWVMAAFAFGYALLQTPSGMWADRSGPRRVLASVVVIWSLFTGLTAAAWNFASLVTIRFLFGAGEAGAFPGMARAVYSWIPTQERGLVKGINFSGGRIGAAVTLPILPWLIPLLGWKECFGLLMAIGFAWAVFWFWWFRDDPAESRISPDELELILRTRQQGTSAAPLGPLPMSRMLGSTNFWAIMAQYFCSNFTFFFCLTWLYPYVKKTYHLEPVTAGLYAMAPFVAGALGNLFSGWLVDRLYRAGHWSLSRRLPAAAGFILAAVGLAASVQQETALGATAWLSLAIFGADVTLAPSWSVCIDIGGAHSGAVSGTMNMAGNLGSAVTGVAFPYLVAWAQEHHVGQSGYELFFYTGASLNVLAAALWLGISPRHSLQVTA